MDLRTWRGRLWLGLSVFIGVSVATLIGPAYLRPLPIWAQLVIVFAGCGVIAIVAIYSRRRVRGTNSPAPRA